MDARVVPLYLQPTRWKGPSEFGGHLSLPSRGKSGFHGQASPSLQENQSVTLELRPPAESL